MSDRMELEKIEWNWKGWNEARRSSGVRALLISHANATAHEAGDGYKVVEFPSRVIVTADSEEAKRDNLKNNTLLKARR